MAQTDQDRLTTIIALVLIGVPLDDAVAMSPEASTILLDAWRDAETLKAN